MHNSLIFEDKARTVFLKGLEQIAQAVKITLGPKGRNVVIEKRFGPPASTKDGVTVAKDIRLKDKFENMGAQMIIEVAQRTADTSGDGTTTAVVLAEAIYREGLRNVVAGVSAVQIKMEIGEALKDVVEQIRQSAMPVKDNEEIRQVASIASNSPEIGEIVMKAIDRVGRDGVITVEDSRSTETTLDTVEGMQVDQGFISPYFSNMEKVECKFENPYILIYGERMSQIPPLIGLLKKIASQQKPLLIIAQDYDPQVIATLVVNKMKGGLGICAIKAPQYGQARKNMLQDISVFTGGILISEELGLDLGKVELKDLGRAKIIKSNKDITTIVEGAGHRDEMKVRVDNLREEIEETASDYDKEKLRERLAKLTSGVAVINVGAATETELKEKKDRIEDSLQATKAALEEGIVAGGGLCLFDIASKHAGGGIGAKILCSAMREPSFQILRNAGLNPEIITQNYKGSWGFDSNKEEYVDMIEAGIVDPALVVRTALENAVSIASLMLITEVAISYELTEDDRKPGIAR